MTNPKSPENLSETISAALEGAGNLLNDPEAIKEAAGKAADTVADYIRKHPYQTVGIAFAAGLLAGVFLTNKKGRSE
jgi:ElaB/YqjD/DUF883 family membrane-anchored ribosome-binding protein